MKNTLLLTYSTWLTVLPKKSENVQPHSGNFIENTTSWYSQSSRLNATPSSGTILVSRLLLQGRTPPSQGIIRQNKNANELNGPESISQNHKISLNIIWQNQHYIHKCTCLKPENTFTFRDGILRTGNPCVFAGYHAVGGNEFHTSLISHELQIM